MEYNSDNSTWLFCGKRRQKRIIIAYETFYLIFEI